MTNQGVSESMVEQVALSVAGKRRLGELPTVPI